MAVRRFRITVDGKTFEVEAEEIGEATSESNPPRKATPPAAREAAPAPRAQESGDSSVAAPLPGNVLDVRVGVGDTVSRGQILVILEAMKMENEITAPVAGTVTAVHVAKGASVNLGDVLVVIH